MSRTIKISVIAVAAGLAAGVATYQLRQSSVVTFKATDITGAPWAQNFELPDHNGQIRRLGDFRGKVVLMFFGYTHCPDECPTALVELSKVVKQLGPDGKDVQVIFITTDPARDTPERLKSYVATFDPSFLALRGTPEQLAAVAKEFKVFFDAPAAQDHGAHEPGIPAGYMVNHSTGVLALDREGRPRLFIGEDGRSVDAVVHDVRLLLRRDS